MSQTTTGAAAQPRFAATIFDMDGVIVDSEALYLEELRAFSAAYGLGATEAELYGQVGKSHQFFCRMLADWLERGGHGSFEPEAAEKLFEAWASGTPRDYAAILNPGVPGTLAALRAAGVRVALASSTPHAIIAEALGQCGLMDAFELIVSGEEFRESKPNPEIYLHTVERLGLPVAACCCVEDSVPGITAGKAAGLTVFAKREERFGFSQEAADAIIDDIPALLAEVLPEA